MATKERRTTVYFDPEIHKALRLKAAETERSISDLVEDAVRILLAEDAEDLEAIRTREVEPTISFERFVQYMRKRGKL
jgi:plasmid stability protein